jgi:hypothetical protein
MRYRPQRGRRENHAMRKRRFQILVETSSQRTPTGVFAAPDDEPAIVALKLREKGWHPYRVRLDETAGTWIAAVIDWKRAA